MFERMEAIKNFKKMRGFVKGMKTFAKLMNDEQTLAYAKNIEHMSKTALPKILLSKKKARQYNLDCMNKGFLGMMVES